MITKEEDFKNRFAVVMRDLQQDGTKDPQITLAMGVLALCLVQELESTTWSAAKSKITPPVYDRLLGKMLLSGEEHYRAGRLNEAYATQVLSFSLVARTQSQDPQMRQGEALIDMAIDRALAVYQQAVQSSKR